MEIATYLGVLRRRWLVLVIVVVASLAAAVSITRSTDESYQAKSTLFINIPAARGVQEALQGIELSSSLMNTYAKIATSRSALQSVVDALELREPVSSLSGRLSARPDPDALLISITAKDNSPEQAAALANAAADVFTDLVDEFEKDRDDPIAARLIEEAIVPSTPVTPKPIRNLTGGLAFGVLVGMAAMLLLEALDRTIRAPEQATRSLDTLMLGAVPRRKEGEIGVLESPALDDPSAEAYRSLRTAIRFGDLGRTNRTLLVTSPSPGEGKTSTAANLAVAFAQSGERVILVDADLRKPRCATLFSLAEQPGVMNVLGRPDLVEAALQPSEFGLRVLTTGPLPPNPSEVCGSSAMAELLRRLEELADLVIVDSPPVLPVSDAVALSTQVDGVLLVARAGRTRRDHAEAARRHLDVVDANIIGCTLVAVPRSTQTYYWGNYRYARNTAPRLGRRPQRSAEPPADIS